MAVLSEKSELLRWFLNFINLKMGDLDDGERLKWITEALYIIEFGVPKQKLRRLVRYDKTATHKKISEWDNGTELEECHALVKDSTAAMMEKIRQAIDSGEGSAPKLKGDHLSIFVELKTAATLRVQTKRYGTIPIKERELRTIIDAKTDAESLLLSFYRALDGAWIGSLRICAECRNYFHHTSKIKKQFCTNKCASRSHSRARREKIKAEDKEKYEADKKKGRERARKSYEKSTPPGSKPERNPSKYKDSTEK